MMKTVKLTLYNENTHAFYIITIWFAIFNPKNKRSPYDGIFWQWLLT